MIYGITGNTSKEKLWHPVAELTRRLYRKGLEFRLHRDVAHGLVERGLADPAFSSQNADDDVGAHSDVLLSFGGDGTMLRSAHHVGTRETPILGVNVGRLGFLTKVGVDELDAMIDRLEEGQYTVEKRMVIECDVEGATLGLPRWALNDFVIDKSGTTSLIAVEAEVDNVYLNTFWADGLIVSTPTGSTAYNLSAGGPIVAPTSEAIVVTPIAPHTLTARPIVLPDRVTIRLRVTTRGHPYVFACDGESAELEGGAEGGAEVTFTIRRASHGVALVTFPDRDYFATIRDKLKWGQSEVF